MVRTKISKQFCSQVRRIKYDHIGCLLILDDSMNNEVLTDIHHTCMEDGEAISNKVTQHFCRTIAKKYAAYFVNYL